MRVSGYMHERKPRGTVRVGGARCRVALAVIVLAGMSCVLIAEEATPSQDNRTLAQPAQVRAARSFLSRRGWTPERGLSPRAKAGRVVAGASALVAARPAVISAHWSALGPTAVNSTSFGLIAGRVTALALDPGDTTGNTLYVGTTGGGVWMASNAATSDATTVSFLPMTDAVSELSGAIAASVSIGALSVQPGQTVGTGVILAGTGDANDVTSSYYGAGILRSTDGGNSWSLIKKTSDVASGLGSDYNFAGIGFAGFAWSTTNTQLVVAAASEAYESTLVGAEYAGSSCKGLYYSTNAGADWHLATIMDGSNFVQGPTVSCSASGGNAATALVWNPVRQMFYAAVRYHGYYQSSDGVTWTRLSAQPGANLTTTKCPSNLGSSGSTGCPLYRGALAVNPVTGDTFAWTVDAGNLDQGLWRDTCSLASGACAGNAVSFATQIKTTALETAVTGGTTGIADGSYTLALAAVPYGSTDTILLAGADDLWRCDLAMGCAWRNTTNATSCMSAKVAPYQHALAYNASNPAEIFLGNDGGLWRSLDWIAETGSACAATDANHFQNMNTNLGSLADVESLAQPVTTPYTMLAGLGVNGATGVKSTTATSNWPAVLGGYGGAVAIDPSDADNWYVNDAVTGVAIYRCAQSTACTAADFGVNPVVASAQVGGDGATMSTPAPFTLDALNTSELLVGTCRLWRGVASSNLTAISGIFDKSSSSTSCQGNGAIAAIAAQKITSTTEVIYIGMRGANNGGGNLAGHVLRATFDATSSSTPSWTDVTSAVSNDSYAMNAFGFEISSLVVDAHDATGMTAYATVAALPTTSEPAQTLYRTTNGGTGWTSIMGNLPSAPVNALAIDPQDANTVYVATDVGVYYTTAAASCTSSPQDCWSVYGGGLPLAPVVGLSASPLGASTASLVAATYGRGLWWAELATSGVALTTATASPTSLDFGTFDVGATSTAQTVTLTNTGSVALMPTAISIGSDFVETENCLSQSIAVGASCTSTVSFRPNAAGALSEQMTISTNVSGGQIVVALTGTGHATTATVTATPVTIDFGTVLLGTTSTAYSVSVQNIAQTAQAISSISISSPFTIASNSCGTTSLAASAACAMTVTFSPTEGRKYTGTLTLRDDAGTQIVYLNGVGGTAPTDTLSTTALAFPDTAVDALSVAETVTITNTGSFPLKSIALSIKGEFLQSSTCGTSLAGNASCVIAVYFAPTEIASLSGTLTIADALRTQTVALSGKGVATPVFSVAPTSLAFTNQTVGIASAPQTVTVTNAGAAPMANVGFQLSGVAASSYVLQANTCGATLAAGASCSVQVVFTPSDSGLISAVLVVSSSTAHVAAASVALNGTAQAANGLYITPLTVNFSLIGVGQTSATHTVTITNNNSFTVAQPVGATSSPFALSQNTCTANLAAGDRCTMTVSFAPTTTGDQSGTLVISSASVTTSSKVTLTGTGFDFSVAASGTSTKTVAAGQTASYNFTIVAASGLTGSYTYSYACSSLPTGATCSFNPTTTTATGGVSGYVTLSITTTGKTSAQVRSVPSALRFIPLWCGLVLVPLAWRRRGRIARLLALLLLVTGLVTGCASAGLTHSGSGSGTITPAGSYSIPVTVTSNGLSHAVTLTLVVD